MSYITRSLGSTTGASYAVEDLAALKALTTRPEVVIVETGQAKGVWQWELGSSTTADDGVVVQCTTGTAGRYKRIFDGDIFATWYYETGSGVDASTGLAAALNAAFARGCGVRFPAGTYSLNDTVVNPGVSMYGDGLSTQFVALSGLTSSKSFFKYYPAASADLSFKIISGLTFLPSSSGSTRGKHCIEFDFSNSGVFSAKLDVTGNFCLAGNDFSFLFNNVTATNPNGNPYLSSITKNICHSGMKFVGLGDSILIAENYIAHVDGIGLDIDQVDGSLGTAAMVIVENNNGSASNGWMRFRAGIGVKVLYNNIEQYDGAGSNGAAIDIDGSENSHVDTPKVPNAEVRGNKIGMFDNPSTTATTAIRINNCIGAVVDSNYLLAGRTFAQAISITANAEDTIVGSDNTFSANWTANITDAGVDTSLPTMPSNTIKGNNTGSAATPANLTRAQVAKMIGSGAQMVGYALAVNLNSVGDTAITLNLPSPAYRVNAMFVYGKTGTSGGTARIGLFTATGGGGTAISALAAPPITAVGVNTAGSIGAATVGAVTTAFNAATLYFRVGTAEGATLTADVFILATPLYD